MKILVLSDTHGEIEEAIRVIRAERPDQILHLGDNFRDAEDLEREFPMIPLCAVPGNNDWFTDEEKEKVLIFGETKVFLCHGHTTGVKRDLAVQIYKAASSGCTLSLFGHTHSPLNEEQSGIRLFNPGSLTHSGTYGVLTLNGTEINAEIKSSL